MRVSWPSENAYGRHTHIDSQLSEVGVQDTGAEHFVSFSLAESNADTYKRSVAMSANG